MKFEQTFISNLEVRMIFNMMTCSHLIIMNSFTSIRQTSTSYNFQPIEEKEEEQEEFVPYSRQKLRMSSIVSDSFEFNSLGKRLSQSLECKKNTILKAKRCKTLNKDEGKNLFSSLAINNTQQLLPLVIHSSKKPNQKAEMKQISKKNTLLKVQSEMKKHRPSFFKELTRSFAQHDQKPARLLHLDAKKSSNLLLELKGKPKEQSKTSQISGKDLKKLMRIQKMQQSLQPIPPPKIQRIKRSQTS